MPWRILLVFASVALLAFAPAPLARKDRRGAEDQTDVSGTWEFVVCDSSSGPNAHTRDNYHAVITKEKFDFTHKNGGSGGGYVMRIDATASPPSFTWSSGNQVCFVGSYRLQKDQLTMIFNSGNRVEARPTDFSGKPTWRYVMRRIRR